MSATGPPFYCDRCDIEIGTRAAFAIPVSKDDSESDRLDNAYMFCIGCFVQVYGAADVEKVLQMLCTMHREEGHRADVNEWKLRWVQRDLPMEERTLPAFDPVTDEQWADYCEFTASMRASYPEVELWRRPPEPESESESVEILEQVLTLTPLHAVPELESS